MEQETSEPGSPDSTPKGLRFDRVDSEPDALSASLAQAFALNSEDALTAFLMSLGVSEPQVVARQLLYKFGSVSALLAGSWWQLQRAVGPRLAHVLRTSREVMRSALVERVCCGPVLGDREQVRELLHFELDAIPHERLLALYVDQKLRLLRIECVAEGSVRETLVNIPRIIRFGFECEAAGLILVHNHPSGDPRPSDADRRFTAKLRFLTTELEMQLVDHLIIGRGAEIRSVVFERNGCHNLAPAPDPAAD